jgi:hypothetical protein
MTDRLTRDSRRNPRHPLHCPAWIVADDGTPRACMMHDISATGARLTKAGEDQVPDDFILWLAQDGSVSRTCRVVWRDGCHVGIEFKPRAKLAPLEY